MFSSAFTRESRYASRKNLRGNVRSFLLDGRPIPAGAWVPTHELIPAVATYLRVGRRFRQRGLAAALEIMPAVADRRRGLDPGDAATAFCARAAGARVLGLARTVAGKHLCLHESLALAAALRRLGFAVEVVLGYPVIERATGEEELHAWPQLGEMAITDRLGSSPLNWVELVRYPTG